MTFDCSLTVSGLDPQKSAKAFIDSYNQTSQLSHYQKFYNKLEQYFVNKINQNISRSNIKNDKFKNSFSMNFKGKNLEALEDIALTQCIKLLDDSHKSFYDADFSILDAAAEFSNVYNSVDKNGNSVLDGYVESDKSAYHKYMDERLDGYLKGKFTV